jgi:hypothetical protein
MWVSLRVELDPYHDLKSESMIAVSRPVEPACVSLESERSPIVVSLTGSVPELHCAQIEPVHDLAGQKYLGGSQDTVPKR